MYRLPAFSHLCVFQTQMDPQIEYPDLDLLKKRARKWIIAEGILHNTFSLSWSSEQQPQKDGPPTVGEEELENLDTPRAEPQGSSYWDALFGVTDAAQTEEDAEPAPPIIVKCPVPDVMGGKWEDWVRKHCVGHPELKLIEAINKLLAQPSVGDKNHPLHRSKLLEIKDHVLRRSIAKAGASKGVFMPGINRMVKGWTNQDGSTRVQLSSN